MSRLQQQSESCGPQCEGRFSQYSLPVQPEANRGGLLVQTRRFFGCRQGGIRQIVDAYGNNESIISNCHVRIAFAPNQFETAELLSKMTGTATVQKGQLQL